MKRPTSYTRLQITLHWVIAFVIAAAWFTHDGMGRALRNRIAQDLSGLDGTTPHTILGGLAFAFVLWRLIVRWRTGAPEPEGHGLQRAAAIWVHRLLYVLMLAVPALGAAAWYGNLADIGEVHEIAGQVLVVVALGHAAAALWHHFVQRDGTLGRMLRVR